MAHARTHSRTRVVRNALTARQSDFAAFRHVRRRQNSYRSETIITSDAPGRLFPAVSSHEFYKYVRTKRKTLTLTSLASKWLVGVDVVNYNRDGSGRGEKRHSCIFLFCFTSCFSSPDSRCSSLVQSLRPKPPPGSAEKQHV